MKKRMTILIIFVILSLYVCSTVETVYTVVREMKGEKKVW